MRNLTRPQMQAAALAFAIALGIALGVAERPQFLDTNWIEVYLLPIFFLLIGMEMRGEFNHGYFRQRNRIYAPLAAAVAGVAVPGAIYVAVTGEFGFGATVPTATDLTLGLATLAFLSSGATARLRVKFIAFATFDDLIGLLFLTVGFGSGLPTTVLGFLIGLLIPDVPRLRTALDLIANYAVVPLFALAAANGFGEHLLSPLSIPVLIGVAIRPIGKLLGIGLAGGLVERALGNARQSRDWLYLGLLGGIGFTVSILLAELAYGSDSSKLASAIAGTLAAILISAVAFLVLASRSARLGHLGEK